VFALWGTDHQCRGEDSPAAQSSLPARFGLGTASSRFAAANLGLRRSRPSPCHNDNSLGRHLGVLANQLCRGEDSNLHGLLRVVLSHVRLPISPPRRFVPILYSKMLPLSNVEKPDIFRGDLFTDFPPIAQLVEHSPLKRLVVGSNPTGRTNECSEFR
jgi:hypothetical protein